MPAYRSRTTTHGRNMAGARGLWRATGMKDGDFGKPIIAVVNSFTQFVPGHVHLKDLGQLVAREIEAAGGVAKEFNTIAVDDGIAMGHDGMLYSLPSRELIADAVEYMVNAPLRRRHGLHLQLRQDHARHAERRDAAEHPRRVRLGRADGGRQGAGQGQAAGARPCRRHGDGGRRQIFRRGSAGDRGSRLPDLRLVLGHVHRQLDELPDRGARPVAARQRLDARHPFRPQAPLRRSGHLVVDLARRYYEQDDESALPRSIATRKAFENAMALDIAMGGSTNTVLHILAAAYEGGVDFTLADIDALSRKVPVLCKVAPAKNDVHMEDVHRAGGIMAILGQLDRAGLINRDEPTIHAVTMGDALDQWDISRTNSENVRNFFMAAPGGVRTTQAFSQSNRWAELDLDRKAGAIRSTENPFSKDGGLAVLKGNVALDGCVVKTAGVDESNLKFTGPAVVFESQDAAVKGILSNEVKAGDVVVIRYEGPKGGPGMQEMLYPTSYLKSKGLGKACALLDRRPFLRRHVRPLDRPRLAGSGGRRHDRPGAPGRHHRDRHPEPHHQPQGRSGDARRPPRRAGRQGLEAGREAQAQRHHRAARLRRLCHQRRQGRRAHRAGGVRSDRSSQTNHG